MSRQVLIAHAPGEESQAELLAAPIRSGGYEVVHRGTVMIGESFSEEASKVMQSGGPIVLCGTVRALGTGWAHRLVNAARQYSNTRIFAVQMEKDAYIQPLSSDTTIGLYWQNPAQAIDELMVTLAKYYPLTSDSRYTPHSAEAERRYRHLALESCDIIDLANLPESDRYLATRHLELRRLYVALRVRVEISPKEIAAEANLKEIENRREATRKLFSLELPKTDEQRRKPDRVPVGHRLSQAQRLIVLGDPGSGKTTLVRWIATSYLLRLNQNPEWKLVPDVSTLPDKDLLPVIVRCRDLDQTGFNGSLDQILSHTFRRTELSEAESPALLTLLRHKLSEGQALLLVDGLDEIIDPVLRIRFCQRLEQISIAYPKAPIVVTSRIVGYKELGYRISRGFEHVTFADLSKEDKDDFARRWCDLTEPPERRVAVANELIHDVHSTDRIERLTGNPMLLTTLALVKRKIGSLPSRRADLYWDALEVLLNWRREVDEPLDHREALPQLEYIAYAMCERGVAQLREDELIELLERMRNEYPQIYPIKKHSVQEFIRLLERRTGILIESGHVRYLGRPTPLFEFRHLTFQEYLAGLALVDGRFPHRDRSKSLAETIATLAGQTSEITNSADDKGTEAGSQEPEITVADNWREAIRLCVASCNDDDVDAALLAILTPREGEDNRINGRSRAVLAALCLADDPNASQNVVYAVLEEFVKHINKKDGLGVVKTTVDIATKELAASRWATALFTLLLKKFVEQDSELQNSFGTLCAMAGLRKVPEGKEAIRQWLNEKATEINSGDELVATGAALQVMFHAFKGTHYRVPALVSGLFSLLNRSPFVAQAAAWALYWINTDKTTGKPWQPTSLEIERMIEYLKSQTSDSLVVRRLIYILGRERAVQSVEAMIARLDDSVETVRIAAAESLGWMCDPRAIDPLIERLNDNGEVQREAIWSLAQLADMRCLDAVIPKLADPDPKTRETAAWALGVIGDDRGVDSLLRKLEDSDVTVRRAAIMALSRIGDVQTVPPVVRKLEAENEDERATAATALSRFGDVQVIDHLIAKLPDPSSKARSKIVIALHRFKDPKVLTALISCLEDEDAEVQKSAANVLGWLKPSLAVEPLIAKMRGNPEVRKACIHALGMIRDVRAVEPLIELIDDENSDVRGLVIEALTQIGDVKAITHLIPKLEDDVVNVRSAAARGLGHLGHTEGVERLCAKIEDGDVEDRELATLALYGLAMKKFESTDIEGAAEIFKMVISNTTEDEYCDSFYNDAAYCFILLKRYEEAAEQFEAMEFAKRDAAWPLYRHNLGLLSYLMGDVDKAHRYLDESLRWIQATTSYNSRDVFCMLLLEPDGGVSSRKDLPVDAGVLINLNRMGGLSQERLHKELERRYRTEYKEWIA